MTSILSPCPSCARHVRAAETHCPFCAAMMPEAPADRPVEDTVRVIAPAALSRASVYALGAARMKGLAAAALATTTLGACVHAPAPLYGVPPDLGTQDMGSTHADSGGPAPLYGAAPYDAGTAQDTGSDSGTVTMTLYGAPPPHDAGTPDTGSPNSR